MFSPQISHFEIHLFSPPSHGLTMGGLQDHGQIASPQAEDAFAAHDVHTALEETWGAICPGDLPHVLLPGADDQLGIADDQLV